MEDMFSFFQDFENFDVKHYIETVTRLFNTDDRFRGMTCSLLALIVVFIITITIYKVYEYK